MVICEEIYIRKLSSEMSELIDSSLESNTNSFEDLIVCWNNNKNILEWLINEKDIERISINMELANLSFISQNNYEFKEYLVDLKIRIDNLSKY
jgi:hypothetical protein